VRFSKCFIFLLCLLTLNACASRPNGKLASDYAGQTFDIGLATYSERDLQVHVERRNAYAGGGGLIGALAVGVIAGVEKAHANMTASDRVKVIKDGFDFDYAEGLEKKYTKTIEDSEWLSVLHLVHANREDGKNPDTIYKKVASEVEDVNMIGVVQYGYTFNEAFNALTSSATLQLRPYKNNHLGQQVYHLHVYDTYYLKNAALTEADDNLDLWLEDDAQEIRTALSKTSEKVRERLGEHLKDPYMKPKG
jgi:hypothetical protein